MRLPTKLKSFPSGIKSKFSDIKDRVSALHWIMKAKALSSMGQKGQGTNSMVNKIVGVAVAIIVVAIIFPIALDELAGVSLHEDLSAVEPLLKLLLPVIAVIAIILYITGRI